MKDKLFHLKDDGQGNFGEEDGIRMAPWRKSKILFRQRWSGKGDIKRRTIPGCEIGTHKGGKKEHDVLGNSEKLAGIDIPRLMDTSWCEPVMEILPPFAREKDGAGGSIRKAGWGQIMSCLECRPGALGSWRSQRATGRYKRGDMWFYPCSMNGTVRHEEAKVEWGRTNS